MEKGVQPARPGTAVDARDGNVSLFHAPPEAGRGASHDTPADEGSHHGAATPGSRPRPFAGRRAGGPGGVGLQVARAFTEYGFYFVRNHGILGDLLADAFAAVERFRGLNQWPADLPGFRETVLAACAALEGLGLSLRLPDGTWMDAPAPEGALLVKGGMMLRRWTNNRFLATPHRVINRSGRERYAIPFFMDASYDAVMAPIPRADGAGDDRPITYKEFMVGYQRANSDHARQEAEKGVELQGV